ncbi:hypothetical protein RHA1_ro08305 (plasmid) [Rhodococcus jostii RHA1]|uniref:Uncharacterized protein n=1 Tax=Rhodococcus jostii (strain RHA1) TaxID=101510 RepID=Q0RZD7_RHOJR|nr:hypothetical protein RHA1_ro08305 [Rhodococcus jostii RHA1]
MAQAHCLDARSPSDEFTSCPRQPHLQCGVGTTSSTPTPDAVAMPDQHATSHHRLTCPVAGLQLPAHTRLIPNPAPNHCAIATIARCMEDKWRRHLAPNRGRNDQTGSGTVDANTASLPLIRGGGWFSLSS